MANKIIEMVNDSWDAIGMTFIKMYLWAEFVFSWFLSCWDKWIHVALLAGIVAIAMPAGNATLALCGVFLAVGYGLGWFFAKVKQ
jgi:hypothetical protein